MSSSNSNPLPLPDYHRYGRQMILDGFGLPGQLKLQSASIVVVGAGGLGCPALQYLAAAGVGTIGIIDHDDVELSNLGRQVLHTEEFIGAKKAVSAAHALHNSNSSIKVIPHVEALTPQNAISLLQPYDIVLDCTDNAPTRYLLSDACVTLHKPLVSGAAQQFVGQLCTYNLGEEGPCYRCLYPKAPVMEAQGTCEELGILGAVVGVIGVLQATEAIKIVTGLHDKKPALLLYSALSATPFRSVKLRSRKPTCPACGTVPEDQRQGSILDTDYVQFCGGPRPDWEKRGMEKGKAGDRAGVKDLEAALKEGSEGKRSIYLLDVRPETEYGICALPSSINVPLSRLVASPAEYVPSGPATETYIVCRLGNDSQIAAEALRSVETNKGRVRDVVGGLRAWARDVDQAFPVY